MLVSVIGVSIGPWLKIANSTITDVLDGHPGYTARAVRKSTTSVDATVERLAKMELTLPEKKRRVLDLTGQVMKHTALRNHYSHSIYAFGLESG